MAGGHAFPWPPVGCLLLAGSAVWLCALGMLTCCTCGCAPTVCWTREFMGFLPVLCPPACSGSAGSGGFSSHLWFTPFAMWPPLRGRGLFVLDRNEGLVCFPFSFGLFLLVVTALRDEVTIWVRCWFGAPAAGSWVLRPFSLWLGFEPLSEASLHALSCRWFSWWSSLRPRVFGCP